jgi:hypothetical protein
MKILFEGSYYPTSTLERIFEDPKFYSEKNNKEARITSVGYYHSFEKNEIIYMLPKVFLKDDTNTIFGKTKEELLELDSIKNTKHDSNYNWIRQSSLYFYNSLQEYRKRITDSELINKTEHFELNTNLGDQEYSYLDLLLSIVNFYKKNKSHILYRHIEHKSNQYVKPKWDKTIRKSLPILTASNAPVYISIRNKKKVVNTEEELLSYYFSILNKFNEDHPLNLKIEKTYKIIKGKSFERLQSNGISKLRKIKYRYFNDNLKRMYAFCELYFSQTDTSSPKKKREDFLTVNNYNLVFENMVDKLFSDELKDTEVNNVSLKSLKKNDDGKIIDHIYDYQSLIDTSNIFYIGDSKYYKSNSEADKLSKYKQFTYAKNIIQFNIDLLNNGKDPYSPKTRYRDDVTEGYNITPNFFIYGHIEDESNFDDPIIKRKKELPVISYHFKDRLFDRDTLFVHQYKINFLFVLKAYTNFNSLKTQKFREKIKGDFREHFVEYFTDTTKSNFELYEYKESNYKAFVAEHFRLINGKTFVTNGKKLILAKHIEDTSLEDILKHFSPFDFKSVPLQQKDIALYSEKSKELSIAADPEGKYGVQGTLELEE